MQLVEKMTMAPNTCLVCGRGNSTKNSKGENGPYVDLQRDVNWNETVYICETCALEVGNCVGMITADEQRELNERIALLKRKLHSVLAKLDKTERKRQIAEKKLRVVGTSISVIRDEKEKVSV